ncbi:Phosphatidylserine/phosphatidylglycerophosphate/cardiolipin synthase [Pseudomonas pohangensis]|uniref:Phosphatidylserine/phosphatidylglycerophosphate/cardiolipin synthase n=2 Tax=Pseudomonas pohangensis TaxID=364197 RepID=A0A1H2EB22_9PSED|nr:Phosphatidylserine/phosphatidylglycerophosphate/cardiolipin synthase [Pseudomonas pohangensis]
MAEVFAWRSGNQFELLIDGAVFFPRMLQAIDQARSCIDLELYLVSSGACATALLDRLVAAAARGVAVRCLLDDFGCQGLNRADRQRLIRAGVSLRWYNPLSWRHGVRNLYRNHRKLLLVDGCLGYVGGAGATDAFWRPGQAQSDWHEVMVEQRGPLLADWQALFDIQWQATDAAKAWQAPAPASLQQLPALPHMGNGWGRVAYASAREHRDILHSLLHSLQGSRQRIWLATPYFLPTWKVRRALRKAASRGLDVRLLLTSRHTDNQPVRYAGQRFYPALLRAGVRIFEFQARFSHLKMVLVDDWVSLGSCNFDHWNLHFNLDANLEAVDAPLSQAVEASFLADFATSAETTLQQWRALPWSERLQQRLWGWLDGLVIRFLRRR